MCCRPMSSDAMPFQHRTLYGKEPEAHPTTHCHMIMATRRSNQCLPVVLCCYQAPHQPNGAKAAPIVAYPIHWVRGGIQHRRQEVLVRIVRWRSQWLTSGTVCLCRVWCSHQVHLPLCCDVLNKECVVQRLYNRLWCCNLSRAFGAEPLRWCW